MDSKCSHNGHHPGLTGGERTLPNGVPLLLSYGLATHFRVGVTKAGAWTHHTAQFLAHEPQVSREGCFLSFRCLCFRLFLFIPFSPFHTPISPTLTVTNNPVLGHVYFCMSSLWKHTKRWALHMQQCILLFYMNAFNFCKWHCFLYPILFLTFYHFARCCSHPPVVPRVCHS